MNQIYTIHQTIMETNSGTLFYLERKSQNFSTYLFGLKYHNQNVPIEYLKEQSEKIQNSQHSDLFRQYQGLYRRKDSYEQQFIEIYLFSYYQDYEILNKKIIEYSLNKTSFSYAQITLYLKNLLIALYELHKQQLPGRIFSVNNLIVSNERLILMDFGFGPDIRLNDLDILAPPEYLQQIINNTENLSQFDLKFDCWLIGAILYHLIKFRPINLIEGQNERLKYNKIEEYYNYLNSIQYIKCQTNRYSEILLNLVQSLLTCNKDKRLSFYQLYQNEFVQSLNIENYSECLEFYKTNQFIVDQKKQIQKNTNTILPPNISITIKQETPQTLESQIVFVQNRPSLSESPNKIRILSVCPLKVDPDYYDILKENPQFKNQNYYTYWLKIQLDCFRCYILEKTSEKILNVLPQGIHIYKQVLVYLFKKMHHILLTEMDRELKSNFFNNQLDNNWSKFLVEYEQTIPTSNQISQYQRKLKAELKNIYKQELQDFLNDDSPILQKTRYSFLSDEEVKYNFVDNSKEFFNTIYKDELEVIFQYINQLIVKNKQQENLNQVKQLLFICLQIIQLFEIEVFKKQFEDILNKDVQPRDVVQYLRIAEE